MSEDDPILVEPTEALRDAYLDFEADFRTAGERQIPGSGTQPDSDFGELVRRLRDHGLGVGLRPGLVPASTYWLVHQGRLLGTCNIRHRLTDALRDFGGHIGYAVRPSERNKGYGTRMLKLALEQACELGIGKALVTCDTDNPASSRVIIHNGGVLASESYSEQAGRITQRYWIGT